MKLGIINTFNSVSRSDVHLYITLNDAVVGRLDGRPVIHSLQPYKP